MASLQFGILMIPYQMLDVAGPVDILSSSSRALLASYLQAGVPGVTAETIAAAIDIEFHHINATMDPVTMTANIKVLPTTTCDTCPELDYLLVGGPDPFNFHLSERFAEFLRAHIRAGKGLFTTCTGGLAISASGVLDGKTATTNHGALELAKKVAPNVNWVQKQWVEEGNIWTAGGACAGMDMMAHWVIERYGMEIAKFAFVSLDYEPRDMEGNRVLPQQHGVESA